MCLILETESLEATKRIKSFWQVQAVTFLIRYVWHIVQRLDPRHGGYRSARYLSSRLETRTKEFDMYARVWV